MRRTRLLEQRRESWEPETKGVGRAKKEERRRDMTTKEHVKKIDHLEGRCS
jgi:hypothetical protein